jgi:hypothetical protein
MLVTLEMTWKMQQGSVSEDNNKIDLKEIGVLCCVTMETI